MSLWYIIPNVKETLVTAKLSDLWSVKPFILILITIRCFWVTIIWSFPEEIIGWPPNHTYCGYSKFNKVICTFDEMLHDEHVHDEIPL